METPTGHFLELIRVLELGADIPPDVASWWHDGCSSFAAGDTKTLDEALGLRGAGIKLPVNTYARQTRDAALVAAFELIEGRNYWTRVQALADAIRAFEGRTWPRVREYREPPARLTPVQRHLFAAFVAFPKVPCSPSRLSEILRQTPVYSP